MVKTNWVIQHTFGDDTTRLVHSLKESNTPHTVLSAEPVYQDYWQSLHNGIDYPVIAHGSIQFCGLVDRKTNWVPGHYSTINMYDCTKYYPSFGGSLLNSDYVMMPYGDLNRKKEWLFKNFGRSDTIFIRPNSGNKIFTGQLFFKERWDRDLKFIGAYNVDPHELCVISSPKNILDEWRFFVYNNVVITGSKYKEEERLLQEYVEISEDNVKNVDDFYSLCFAQKVLDRVKWKGDNVWSLDICRTKSGQYYVLEIGCFSCAGIYGANTDKLVEAVNEAALKDWRDTL